MPQGNFGAFQPTQKLTPRAPKNKLDVSTIVSILPFRVIEKKPTLQPSIWVIEKSEPGDFSILVVDGASWWKHLEPNQPLLEIPVSSMRLAKSIIEDYCNSFIGANVGEQVPGMFYIPGKYTKETIKKFVVTDESVQEEMNYPVGTTFEQLLTLARVKQENWYRTLVGMADVDWARTNGNPRSISDLSRLAGQHLKLTKPWMQDFQAFQLDACPACGQLTNLVYPVCRHCKAIINPAKAKELNLSFVG